LISIAKLVFSTTVIHMQRSSPIESGQNFLLQRFAKRGCDLSTGCRKWNCRCLRRIIFSSKRRKNRVYSWRNHAEHMVIFDHSRKEPVFTGK